MINLAPVKGLEPFTLGLKALEPAWERANERENQLLAE